VQPECDARPSFLLVAAPAAAIADGQPPGKDYPAEHARRMLPEKDLND
jgi:hypothetical protein